MNEDSMETAAGRVLGTEDATPLTYSFALQVHGRIQLDEVVVTRRELPDGQQVTLSGVVTQVRARHEGAHFDSDVFLIEEGVLPAEVVEAADVMITRVEPEIYVPPLPGSQVEIAVGDVETALFISTRWSSASSSA